MESAQEEQDLCNEAVDSGKYDELSDAEWIALCEQIATRSRDKAKATEKAKS